MELRKEIQFNKLRLPIRQKKKENKNKTKTLSIYKYACVNTSYLPYHTFKL